MLGEVDPLLYGHFTEHLVTVMYDGLWSELLFGRKFEAPMVGREAELAGPWEPFEGRTEGTAYLRGPAPLPRYASPQGQAHHAQGVATAPDAATGERGISQRHVPLDAGTTYHFRGSVRRVGPAGTLRVALRASDGVRVLADATLDVPEVNQTRFGPDFPHNALWMDDTSWHAVEADLTIDEDEPQGVFTLTFEPSSDATCLWMFDWVSLMPADHLEGWHAEVIEALRELPVRALKWPGGCMAEDYDWRDGIGPRDTRYGSVDQAWAAWDENDVGIDEFLTLCRLTAAEPILGVNGGNGSPEMAAALVEYCNGDRDTTWGARRVDNGHPEPYDVHHWVVGNEQWGFFAVGFAGADAYVRRYLDIARAMREVDPSISISAVGQAGDFNRTVLREAAGELDMLQIHAYTPDEGFEVSDGASAARKIASAVVLERILEAVREDIASVDGAGHVRVNLDEWGWGRAGHTGAIFMAAGLNAFHRLAPLVAIGAKAAVMNVDGVLERRGQDVVRTSAFDVFRLYNLGHLDSAVSTDVSGDGTDRVDVSALASDGRASVFLVNRAPEPTDVRLRVEGVDDDASAQVIAVVPTDAGPAGPSTVVEHVGKLGEVTELAPLSLTLVRIGD